VYRLVAQVLLSHFLKSSAAMILSSDELEVLDYLKSWNGKFVTMVEICRCAGGRKKFREDAHWAKCLMSRLVDARMVEVNERGHYRVVSDEPVAKKQVVGVLGDDYFPKPRAQGLVGEDYFPAASNAESETETEPAGDRWISPQMAQILKQAGKKLDGHK
jgi:hypothetical protein